MQTVIFSYRWEKISRIDNLSESKPQKNCKITGYFCGIKIAQFLTVTIIHRAEDVMEIAIGIFVYLVVVFGFVSFGRFLKECDESMAEQLKRE